VSASLDAPVRRDGERGTVGGGVAGSDAESWGFMIIGRGRGELLCLALLAFEFTGVRPLLNSLGALPHWCPGRRGAPGIEHQLALEGRAAASLVERFGADAATCLFCFCSSLT
jgi:hypothetical protein